MSGCDSHVGGYARALWHSKHSLQVPFKPSFVSKTSHRREPACTPSGALSRRAWCAAKGAVKVPAGCDILRRSPHVQHVQATQQSAAAQRAVGEPVRVWRRLTNHCLPSSFQHTSNICEASSKSRVETAGRQQSSESLPRTACLLRPSCRRRTTRRPAASWPRLQSPEESHSVQARCQRVRLDTWQVEAHRLRCALCPRGRARRTAPGSAPRSACTAGASRGARCRRIRHLPWRSRAPTPGCAAVHVVQAAQQVHRSEAPVHAARPEVLCGIKLKALAVLRRTSVVH